MKRGDHASRHKTVAPPLVPELWAAILAEALQMDNDPYVIASEKPPSLWYNHPYSGQLKLCHRLRLVGGEWQNWVWRALQLVKIVRGDLFNWVSRGCVDAAALLQRLPAAEYVEWTVPVQRSLSQTPEIQWSCLTQLPHLTALRQVHRNDLRPADGDPHYLDRLSTNLQSLTLVDFVGTRRLLQETAVGASLREIGIVDYQHDIDQHFLDHCTGLQSLILHRNAYADGTALLRRLTGLTQLDLRQSQKEHGMGTMRARFDYLTHLTSLTTLTLKMRDYRGVCDCAADLRSAVSRDLPSVSRLLLM